MEAKPLRVVDVVIDKLDERWRRDRLEGCAVSPKQPRDIPPTATAEETDALFEKTKCIQVSGLVVVMDNLNVTIDGRHQDGLVFKASTLVVWRADTIMHVPAPPHKRLPWIRVHTSIVEPDTSVPVPQASHPVLNIERPENATYASKTQLFFCEFCSKAFGELGYVTHHEEICPYHQGNEEAANRVRAKRAEYLRGYRQEQKLRMHDQAGNRARLTSVNTERGVGEFGRHQCGNKRPRGSEELLEPTEVCTPASNVDPEKLRIQGLIQQHNRLLKHGYVILDDVLSPDDCEAVLAKVRGVKFTPILGKVDGNMDERRLQGPCTPWAMNKLRTSIQCALDALDERMEVKSISVLKSEAGGSAQECHTDMDPRAVSSFIRSSKCIPVNCVLALMPDTKLCVYPRCFGLHRARHTEVRLRLGHMLVFRGDLSHRGCAYEVENYRLHIEVDPKVTATSAREFQVCASCCTAFKTNHTCRNLKDGQGAVKRARKDRSMPAEKPHEPTEPPISGDKLFDYYRSLISAQFRVQRAEG